MYSETFTDLLADLEDAREEWERAFDARLKKMTDQFDDLV